MLPPATKEKPQPSTFECSNPPHGRRGLGACFGPGGCAGSRILGFSDIRKPRRWIRDENLQPEDNRKPWKRALSETFPVLAQTRGQRVARHVRLGVGPRRRCSFPRGAAAGMRAGCLGDEEIKIANSCPDSIDDCDFAESRVRQKAASRNISQRGGCGTVACHLR
jgi:hypothetical protein